MTKRNTMEGTAVRTQGRGAALFGLHSVRRKARKEKETRFTALLHHVDERLLWQSFYQLKRQAVAGIDNVTWTNYQKDLKHRIVTLHEQLHSGRYRAQPARRAEIEKDKHRKRYLSISALEDKIIQQAAVTILSNIYEANFLGFSYGFREGRNQHDALDALATGIERRKINWILDADIKGFFDNINHDRMIGLLKHRIGDKRILRLINKWMKTGYIENGKRIRSQKGTPQGSVISPLLSNIYLHYVLDTWVDNWRKTRERGDVIIVRYADDFIVGFQYETEARKFLKDLEKRLADFDLELHPEKTRLIEFGRYAKDRRDRGGKGKPPTFNFLGFTHICATNRDGRFFIRRITSNKKLVRKCKEVRDQLKRRMHLDTKICGDWLASVIIGHQNYYAVPGNIVAVKAFRTQAIRSWIKILRRRSQKGKKLNWKRYGKLVNRLIPEVKVVHPWPKARFDAKTQGRSRMR